MAFYVQHMYYEHALVHAEVNWGAFWVIQVAVLF